MGGDQAQLVPVSRWGGKQWGTHLERHSSLKAWIAMRVMFTDIKQKGNCWNEGDPRLVATHALAFCFLS